MVIFTTKKKKKKKKKQFHFLCYESSWRMFRLLVMLALKNLQLLFIELSYLCFFTFTPLLLFCQTCLCDPAFIFCVWQLYKMIGSFLTRGLVYVINWPSLSGFFWRDLWLLSNFNFPLLMRCQDGSWLCLSSLRVLQNCWKEQARDWTTSFLVPVLV